ncbi:MULTISPECIES: tail assembly protein [unclassified Pseudomonas]|uniref:tail assembly protein n=1 Tax=unclassified Pseudomonas TaxID=196821 RepID=UPI000C877DB3|nr:MULTISPECIES: tail assembly protein [unclassified Pseudomonas]PMU11850.1 tail assembly protein [Pseudomonas sp. FW305-20]PMU20006.1 tail assembly protein [Pseudomonas sp. FW305-122]PMU43104.1 tail assembly protein [Pseudomonas sp. FW305-47B]PMX64431.1 tail assembly protein [Pseudomonas sp. FW305-33]PMX68813.1 tail assembly protein [Pseudomonas sp. FW305-60]
MSSCLNPPIRTVKLYGQLRQFGKSYPLAVRTPAEAIKALCVQIPGFERFISNAKSRGLVFAVFLGKKNISEAELCYQGGDDIIIAPVIEGSKRAGMMQTIIGVALIIVATIATGGVGGFAAGGAWGAVGAAGASMAIGGVIQMLSPQAGGLRTSAAPENTPGYAFGSAKNTTASGNPVPLCYGKRRVGGAIISAAIYAEDQM